MNLRLNAARVGSLLFAIVFAAADSRADYIVNGGEFLGTHRVSDDGTIIGSYYPPPEAAGLYETYGEDIAVTPDLKTLYQFTNSLGFSTAILAYDAATRAYLPDKLLHSGGYGFNDDFIANAMMSLIRPNDPLGAGDLFSVSGSFPYLDLTPQIKRYNRTTDSYVETIDPPAEQAIYDFGFGPDDRLYMAAENGIFVYQETAAGFDLVSPTPLLGGLTGKLTFGPDGRMYLMNSVTDAIERYTTDGTFVDAFVSTPIFTPDVRNSSIQFGVDGNIHVLVGPTLINKFDGTTGALLGSTDLSSDNPDFQFGAAGRVTYLPVPEPTSLLLAAMGATLVIARRRHCP